MSRGQAANVRRAWLPPAAGAPPAGGNITRHNTQTATSAGATTLSIPKPTSLIDGSLVAVSFTLNAAATVTGTPSGTWTLVHEILATTPRVHLYLHLVPTASSEPATYDFTLSASVSFGAQATDYHGDDPTALQDVAAIEVADNVGAPGSLGGLTTVTDGALVLYAFGIDANTSNIVTVPTESTEVVQVAGKRHAFAEELRATAGATGTRAWDWGPTGTGGSAVVGAAIMAALRPAPGGGGQTIGVGQATETETAQPVSRSKTRAAAQAAETETAQAITARKTAAAGQAAETETAQAVTRAKARTLGQAIESETAQAVSFLGPKIIAVGQAVEAETGQAVGARKTRAVGQAAEAEQAQTATVRKTRALAQATETETAQPAGRLKARAAGQAVETETGQAVARRKTRTVGQATETETAQPIGQPGEIIVAVGQATETETAQPVTPRLPLVVGVGQVVEAEQAQVVTRVKLRTLGQAAEAEAAQALARLKTGAVGQALEVETAQLIAPTGGAPPPRWVEGASGGTALVEAATGGSGQVELAGGVSGTVEGSTGI
jgi:hypothetical protein